MEDTRFANATKSDLKRISRAVWQYNREWDCFKGKWVRVGTA